MTVFLAMFDPRSSIVKKVFDCPYPVCLCVDQIPEARFHKMTHINLFFLDFISSSAVFDLMNDAGHLALIAIN